MTRIEKIREYLATASPEHAAKMFAKVADRQCHICAAFGADGVCENLRFGKTRCTCAEGIEAWLLEEVTGNEMHKLWRKI